MANSKNLPHDDINININRNINSYISEFRVPPSQLSRICALDDELGFCKTSLDAPPLEGVIGQDRAVRAMQFGLSMDVHGYHIFVVGAPGTGKNTYVQTMVKSVAETGDVPDDWCYIHNFAEPDHPQAVSLSAGQGRVFQADIDELITDLRMTIPKAFASSDYEQRKEQIVEDLQGDLQEGFNLLRQEAWDQSFELKQMPGRFVFTPLRKEKPLSTEDFNRLDEEEQKLYQERGRRLEKRLDELLHEGRMKEKKAKEQVLDLEKQITRDAAAPMINRLIDKYKENDKIVSYLKALLADVEEEHERFKDRDGSEQQQTLPFMSSGGSTEDDFLRYKVNLFVNNEKTKGAPVITESFLHYYNLFGKIEYRSQMMEMTTHFTMAKNGALHRANGGYLILQAKDVISEPFVWQTLKRALKYQSTVLENIGEQYRYVPIKTMSMQPIPLRVKVILIGPPILFHLLTMYDEDFQKLFKVKVEFDTEMKRSQDSLRKYASFIQSICDNDKLLPFNQDGLARVVEYGSRLAGSQNKLSTRFNDVSEVVYEAHAMARQDKAETVDARHVQAAIHERKYRNNRIEEKIQENIIEKKILIDTSGEVIGQINGLSVIQLGQFMFGQPSRITAVTYIGRGGVINIERETEMSGQIHSKGVLTMAGYLGATFAQEFPLSLTAQITFEQNYSGVDGDSASCAELYAILSSLAQVPIEQSLAVTGSVNQLGFVQPIGGATEKIEGFFDICKAKGLTGDQGVIIPIQNKDDLMLKSEILEAVEQGQFHVYAISRIEEGLTILTGMQAGKRDHLGAFPEDSVYGKVMATLSRYQASLKQKTENIEKTPEEGVIA